MHRWFTGGGTTRNLLAVFESPYGHQGLHRRDHTIDERQQALAQGKPWLVDGFCEGAKTYIDGGAKIFIHDGCPDLGRLAADMLKGDSPAARCEFLAACYDFVMPHLAVGMGIGLDNLSAWGEETASYGLWQLLKTIGCDLQMEAAWGPDKAGLYRDAIVFAHWANFVPSHLKQEPWAKQSGLPAFDAPQFADYREFRVVLPFDVLKDQVKVGQTKEYVEAVADLTRSLLAKPNVRVLLIDWLVQAAVKAGVSVERFLPEAVK
jgi:hypothetical protein